MVKLSDEDLRITCNLCLQRRGEMCGIGHSRPQPGAGKSCREWIKDRRKKKVPDVD